MPAFKDRLGEEKYSSKGYLMKIVEYKNSRNIIVEFQDDKKYRVKTNYGNFCSGKIANKPFELQNNLIGKEKLNTQGSLMKIISFQKYNNITVEFQDEYKSRINCTYKNFSLGEVRNPYFPSKFNIGYMGIGKYDSTYMINDKINIYSKWDSMMKRCYSAYGKDDIKKKTYYGKVKVCDEWLNFQNFAKWYEDNYYDIGEELEIDKDILIKGNKIYSPNTCLLVPKKINMLFIRLYKEDRKNVIGVHKKYKHFEAVCNNKCLGCTKTKEEAFFLYKNYKENKIKETANEYKNYIPFKVYEALMNYKIDITD